jgi:hypothetical protein
MKFGHRPFEKKILSDSEINKHPTKFEQCHEVSFVGDALPGCCEPTGSTIRFLPSVPWAAAQSRASISKSVKQMKLLYAGDNLALVEASECCL